VSGVSEAGVSALRFLLEPPDDVAAAVFGGISPNAERRVLVSEFGICEATNGSIWFVFLVRGFE
jgi:hypothetical protein